jgi:glycerol kinase
MKKYVCAIDQGTTSTRFIIFDKEGNIVGSDQLEHEQIYPESGWVEHDASEIWEKTQKVIIGGISKAQIKVKEIASVGITNQRETTVIWNKKTGKPYYNAIVWQDVRTSEMIKKISIENRESIKNKTGLPLNNYFSAIKIKWLLENIPGLKEDAKKGDALFGTIDSWLIWNLTGGVHVTDVTNASRTMLMNLKTLDWDEDLIKIFDIPLKLLPKIKSSSEIYGNVKGILESVPISGDLGDQQAALFGQTCFKAGEVKNTYGTGCFMLLNTGENPVFSSKGLLTTVAFKIGKEKAHYALEGSVAIAGALVQWLRDNMGIINKSSEVEKLAEKVKDNGGVYFVPAFSGLFAPYWRDDARGTLVGMTRYSNKNHIARASLEATTYQTKDVLEVMQEESNIKINQLKVDGGMVVNNLLMQFQSDILNIPVIKPKVIETTALGAAYASGLAVGFWKNKEELIKNWSQGKKWDPVMEKIKREGYYNKWKKAVEKSMNWL